MAEPIKATVIRAWDKSIITAFWEPAVSVAQTPWFVIKVIRAEGGDSTVREVRLNPGEAHSLADLIDFGLEKAGVKRK